MRTPFAICNITFSFHFSRYSNSFPLLKVSHTKLIHIKSETLVIIIIYLQLMQVSACNNFDTISKIQQHFFNAVHKKVMLIYLNTNNCTVDLLLLSGRSINWYNSDVWLTVTDSCIVSLYKICLVIAKNHPTPPHFFCHRPLQLTQKITSLCQYPWLTTNICYSRYENPLLCDKTCLRKYYFLLRCFDNHCMNW